MKLISLLGNSQKLDGGAMFGNAPKAMWQRWYDCDDLNRIHLQCRCLLVQHEGKNILFETGVGAFFSPEMKDRFGVQEPNHVLIDSLAEQGLAPEDIDIIVLSHMHFDHAGGMLTPYKEGEEPKLVFTNAQVIVSEAAWQRAITPHPRDRASFIPHLNSLLETSGKLHRVQGTRCELLGDAFRFHYSDGHTPGMLLTEIDSEIGAVVFAADLIPGTAWVHVPLSMGYDRYPEILIDEKRRLLADLNARDGKLFFTHDPSIAMGTVDVNEKGKYSVKDTVASF
ncbi:MBL fold metallo-hydrolase [Reinekea forsetii]|nr:MBL fold metallo-hydrolase [Reinekea forsetii]